MNGTTTTSADRIPSHVYGTADVEPRHQFDAWLSIMRPLVSMDPRSPIENGFLAQAIAWDLGPFALTRVAMPAIDFRRDTARLKADSVDHWTLGAPRSGTLASESGDITAAGLCHVRSLHRMSVGWNTKLDIVTLVLPRDFCLSQAAGLDLLHDRHIRSGLGGLLADYLHSLERQLPTLSPGHLPSVVEATRAMVIACTAPGRDTLAEAMSAIQATQMERAKQFIRQNLLSPRLGVEELCRQLGMSRTSLYRLFEPLGGVVQYIRSARLLDAHRILSNSTDTRPIYEVGAERGFVGPSEFSRAFKRHFGYSPSEARHEARLPPMQKNNHKEMSTASLGELVALFGGRGRYSLI
ncbi:helix-turn-helix domain-containing protein [Corticibacterium sp. UT-5YL-CI-8]|nr:helix-turn-helix domain-containing protein [Tianweitania sp. UT-5YL-CI-8]